MSVRRATIEDLPRLVALNNIAHAIHATNMPTRFRSDPSNDEVAAAFREQIEKDSSFWLVAEIEEIAGFLSSEFRTRQETWCMVAHESCYLAGIVVAPKYRRQGIARSLIEALQSEAKARGVDQIELDVWAFNDQARSAFEGLGFEPMMQRMRLRLSDAAQGRSREATGQGDSNE